MFRPSACFGVPVSAAPPNEADKLAAKGLDRAIRSLTRPAKTGLKGPKPKEDGDPLAPYDSYGHDVLYWLDRMVRTQAPLIERMALIWHDWFATGDVGSQKLSLKQISLFRKQALGSFDRMLRGRDPGPGDADLALGDLQHQGLAERELRARADGAVRARRLERGRVPLLRGGRARAGAGADGLHRRLPRQRRLRQLPLRAHRGTTRARRRSSARPATSTGRTRAASASSTRRTRRTSSRACGRTSSARRRTRATQSALEELYVSSGYGIRPVVEAILAHPDLYEGPSLVKAPMVAIAGMLRARGRGVDTGSWTWISDMAGQRPFRPPNVSGWDEQRWLDTSSFRGRWYSVAEILTGRPARPGRPTRETRPRRRRSTRR